MRGKTHNLHGPKKKRAMTQKSDVPIISFYNSSEEEEEEEDQDLPQFIKDDNRDDEEEEEEEDEEDDEEEEEEEHEDEKTIFDTKKRKSVHFATTNTNELHDMNLECFQNHPRASELERQKVNLKNLNQFLAVVTSSQSFDDEDCTVVRKNIKICVERIQAIYKDMSKSSSVFQHIYKMKLRMKERRLILGKAEELLDMSTPQFANMTNFFVKKQSTLDRMIIQLEESLQ